ncbi:MAG: restriction endonuclease subunit S [bacterium]|nr:restriction endonuclease subunit S [bacterium]
MEWRTLQLGELLDYRNGLWAGKDGEFTRAKVIRVTEMRDNGTYDLSTAKELQVEARKLTTRKVVPNSILLERSGGGENKPVGRVILFGDDVLDDVYSFSNFTTLLIPKADLVTPKYIFYFVYFFHLSGKTKNLQKAVTGIRNLEFAKYLEQKVAVPFKDGKPDLAEQKRIADKLDKVFAELERGLSSVVKNSSQTNTLKQSVLADAFASSGLVDKKLSDIAEVNPRKDFSSLKTSDDVSFVPMDSVDEITGTITKKQTKKLGAVSKGYTFFRNGDVIFAKITPCMENGKCAVAKELTNGMGFGSTEFYVIRAKDDILPEYLWLFLRQEKVRSEAKTHFTGAAGHKRVPKDFMENLEIPVPIKNDKPDMAEQKRIVSEFEKVSVLSEQLSNLLLRQEGFFTTLRSSALSQSFQMQT